MKFLPVVSFLAGMATAVSVDLSKRDSPIDVKLEMAGNTAVKATITNTGLENLKLFKTGTLLGKASTEKVDIFKASEKVEFDGIRLRISSTNLDESNFEILVAGQSLEVEFDVGEAHDLSAGGAYDISTSGVLSYAKEDSVEIAGALPYTSNTVSTSVDGAAAAAARESYLSKRTSVQSDCSGSYGTATRTALTNCRSLAAAASQAAASGAAAKVTEYFKSSTSSVRSTVAGVFSRVASECGSTTSGVSRYYCSDVYGACSSNVLAYTLPSSSYMVNCPLYFSALSALSRTCHAQDQATTTLHEVTHLTQIKGTSDYNGYGYNYVRSLSGTQNLNHADTYALFANAIYVGC